MPGKHTVCAGIDSLSLSLCVSSLSGWGHHSASALSHIVGPLGLTSPSLRLRVIRDTLTRHSTNCLLEAKGKAAGGQELAFRGRQGMVRLGCPLHVLLCATSDTIHTHSCLVLVAVCCCVLSLTSTLQAHLPLWSQLVVPPRSSDSIQKVCA